MVANPRVCFLISFLSKASLESYFFREAARAIVPYVDAQQIILNSNSEYKQDDSIELDNVPTNDLLFDSYNYSMHFLLNSYYLIFLFIVLTQ